MKTLEQIDKELYELNNEIMELKTRLYILQGRKKDLIEEHNKVIMDLQYRLNEKDKENGR